MQSPRRLSIVEGRTRPSLRSPLPSLAAAAAAAAPPPHGWGCACCRRGPGDSRITDSGITDSRNRITDSRLRDSSLGVSSRGHRAGPTLPAAWGGRPSLLGQGDRRTIAAAALVGGRPLSGGGASHTPLAGRTAAEPWQVKDPDILSKFKTGFLRFKAEALAKDADHFAKLGSIQAPKVLVVGCCDSRVSPSTLLSADPADIYSIRNVANLVPPYELTGSYHGTSAALEFAVCVLAVQHIIVLGHTDCGGIRALMGAEDMRTYHTDGDFIGTWMKIAAPALERTRRYMRGAAPAEQAAYCEKEAINVSLANLLTYPWIKEKVTRKELGLHGWLYDMRSAKLDTWSMEFEVTDFDKVF